MASWAKISFMDSVLYVMEYMVDFHDHVMSILVVILTLVGYLMLVIMMGVFTSKVTLDHQVIEILWTVVPGVVLIFIAFPSLQILYWTDDMNESRLVLSVMGHQWYWSYEYGDYGVKEFDSYMLSEGGEDNFRLLDVDNRVMFPYSALIRVVVSAADVIHSWAVPAMAAKVDAVPGRLNQTLVWTHHRGVYYGQCSEICGANHSFMPIVAEVVGGRDFFRWLKTA